MEQNSELLPFDNWILRSAELRTDYSDTLMYEKKEMRVGTIRVSLWLPFCQWLSPSGSGRSPF
jgi:hypothetical protein